MHRKTRHKSRLISRSGRADGQVRPYRMARDTSNPLRGHGYGPHGLRHSRKPLTPLDLMAPSRDMRPVASQSHAFPRGEVVTLFFFCSSVRDREQLAENNG